MTGFFGASDLRVEYDRIVSDSDPTDPNLGPKPGIRRNLLILVGFHVRSYAIRFSDPIVGMNDLGMRQILHTYIP